MDVEKQFKVTRYTVPSVTLTLQPSVSWRSREQDALLGIPRKRLPKKRQRTVSTRRRGLLGIPRSNRHGSRGRCFRKKFSQHLRTPQLRPSQSGLEFPAGTRVGFAKATARIRGIGRRWRSLLAFQRAGEQLTLNCLHVSYSRYFSMA